MYRTLIFKVFFKLRKLGCTDLHLSFCPGHYKICIIRYHFCNIKEKCGKFRGKLHRGTPLTQFVFQKLQVSRKVERFIKVQFSTASPVIFRQVVGRLYFSF